jgi:hypothetical protein
LSWNWKRATHLQHATSIIQTPIYNPRPDHPPMLCIHYCRCVRVMHVLHSYLVQHNVTIPLCLTAITSHVAQNM